MAAQCTHDNPERCADAQELSQAELLDRIQAGYSPARRQALEQELAHLRQEPDGAPVLYSDFDLRETFLGVA